jgi:hypothetical protein
MISEVDNALNEIKAAHQTLDKYIGRQHWWSVAGRIDGLVAMVKRYYVDGRIDELMEKWSKDEN